MSRSCEAVADVLAHPRVLDESLAPPRELEVGWTAASLDLIEPPRESDVVWTVPMGAGLARDRRGGRPAGTAPSLRSSGLARVHNLEVAGAAAVPPRTARKWQHR